MRSNFVSIITVNYNGIRYLENFFNSVRKLKYPKTRLEIIMVDNGSEDDSVPFTKECFPEVRVIDVGYNSGFSEGNNLGIEKARGDLLLLINNDTVLEKLSVNYLVDCFDRWNRKFKVGAVNSKLVLFDSYIPFTIQNALFGSFAYSDNKAKVGSNQYVITHDSGNNIEEKLFIPLDYQFNGNLTVKLEILKFRTKDFSVRVGDIMATEKFTKRNKSKRISVVLEKEEIKRLKTDLIQNSGNYIFKDGYARDRGSLIIRNTQYYESDCGQYNSEETVPAFCGAGVLINKSALKDVGYFDKNFFMYYEDCDLSIRLIKRGWKIMYCPKAVIRHIHAASSKEWSLFFKYNVEKNRLLIVIKHWPISKVLTELYKYIVWRGFGVFIYNIYVKDRSKAYEVIKIRLKILKNLIPMFLRSVTNRRRLTAEEINKYI